ncbi:hypothetical protein Dda_9287 [Drechslerella dactyloides]|uniref:Uncharacterized protein n=1 Tax=Drechslerella dactyloides TaxID=74499 RepID=A0AAD6IPG8_DREDA|nr:hypothetical protein Dda_9287 [Drechslerella dactyloides]
MTIRCGSPSSVYNQDPKAVDYPGVGYWQFPLWKSDAFTGREDAFKAIRLPPAALKAVCLTCSALRELAGALLYRRLVLRWDRESGLDVLRVERVLASSSFSVGQIRRIDIVPNNCNWEVSKTVNLKFRPPSGLAPAEDLLFKLLLQKLGADQLRSISVSAIGGVSTEAIDLLLKTQTRLANLDISTNTDAGSPRYVDLIPHALGIKNLESLGLLLGETENATSKTFAFLYHALRGNSHSLKSLYISFNSNKSELYRELVLDVTGLAGGQSATARIVRLFVGPLAEGGPPMELKSLRQIRLDNVPCFDRICKLAGPELLSQLSLDKLQLLRLDRCRYSDDFLKALAGKVPNMRVLQLITSCSWKTVEEILPRIGPLEVLHIVVDGGAPISYDALEHQMGSLRSLWVEAPSLHPDVALELDLDISVCCGGLKLEQLALQGDAHEFGNQINDLAGLRFLRILFTWAVASTDPGLLKEEQNVRSLCKELLVRSMADRGSKPALQVVAVIFGNPGRRIGYFVVEFVRTLLGDYEVVLSRAKQEDLRRLFPDLTMAEFKFYERVWDDVRAGCNSTGPYSAAIVPYGNAPLLHADDNPNARTAPSKVVAAVINYEIPSATAVAYGYAAAAIRIPTATVQPLFRIRVNTTTTQQDRPTATPQTPMLPPETFWFNYTSDVPFKWVGPQFYAIPVFRGGKWLWPWGSPAPTPLDEWIIWGEQAPWPPRRASNTSSKIVANSMGRGTLDGRQAAAVVSLSTSVETVYYSTAARNATHRTSAAITHTYAIGPVTETARVPRTGAGESGWTVTTRVETQTYRVYVGVVTMDGSPHTFLAGESVAGRGAATTPGFATLLVPTPVISVTTPAASASGSMGGGEAPSATQDLRVTGMPVGGNGPVYTPSTLQRTGCCSTVPVGWAGNDTRLADPLLPAQSGGVRGRADLLLAAFVAFVAVVLV